MKKMKFENTETKKTQFMCSLGGDGPKYEFVSMDDEEYGEQHRSNKNSEPLSYQRARVLCSYDAKDNTELNLIGNEVSPKHNKCKIDFKVLLLCS